MTRRLIASVVGALAIAFSLSAIPLPAFNSEAHAGELRKIEGGLLEGIAIRESEHLLERRAAITAEKRILSGAAERAKEVHSALSSRSQRSMTTAVTETREGIRVVTSNENRLRRSQRVILQPGEVEGRGNGHAEVTGVRSAIAQGLPQAA